MNRREALRALASLPSLAIAPTVQGQGRLEPVRYEVYGAGPTIIVGPPITLSSPEAIRTGYLTRLTDRYRVILMDYPSGHEQASSFTPDRVSRDMLTVADMARANRFAWFGFSWGGV